MARKVLISFLGTGGLDKNNKAKRIYRKAKYKIEGKEYETSFVTSALAEHFSIDKFILIGTMKSMWEDVYKYFTNSEDDYYWELAEITDLANHTTIPNNDKFSKLENAIGLNSKILIVKYGLDEAELAYNLKVINQIENELEENDEIYLDITHTFRSLSLLLMTSIMYVREVSNKKVNITGIYYGMLDVIGELGYAPIVNLKLIDETTNWIKGAYTFKNFGNARLITELLNEEHNISKNLGNFSNAVSINYAAMIKGQIEKLKKLDLKGLDLPSSLIVPQVIESFTDKFKNAKTDSQFQIELAEWYSEKHIYSSAYLVLAESLITYVCESQENLKDDITNRENRNTAKSLILDKNYKKINDSSFFRTIYKIRNDIGHASISNRSSMISDIDNLERRIKKAKKIIYSLI